MATDAPLGAGAAPPAAGQTHLVECSRHSRQRLSRPSLEVRHLRPCATQFAHAAAPSWRAQIRRTSQRRSTPQRQARRTCGFVKSPRLTASSKPFFAPPSPSPAPALLSSAGGLLAASLAVAHADPVYRAVDAADEQFARPAFAGLVYPVVSGDRMRVGTGPAARFDADRRVRRDTPPIFIAHALDDPVVPLSEPMSMMTAARILIILSTSY